MVADNRLGFSATSGHDGVVSVVGDVDIATAPFLEKALREALTHSAGNLVVDLSDVPFMDSAGMNVFVRVFKSLDAESCSLTIVNPRRAVRRALQVGGADTFAEVR